MPEMTTMTIPRTRQGVRDLDQIRGAVLPFSGGPAAGAGSGVNVGSVERLACALGGGALVLFGLKRGTLAGFALAALGGGLIYRGVGGHCPLFAELGWNTAGDTDPDAEVVYLAR
jgi:hypothetical protein